MNIQKIIDEIVEEQETKSIDVIHSLLRSKSEEYDDPDKNILLLLSNALSLHYCRGNIKEPYRPYLIFNDRRSADISDFSENDLDTLAECLDTIHSHNIRARVLDILWLRKRNIGFAKKAIDEYLSSAKELLDYKHWVETAESIERAVELSLLFRRKEKEIFEKICSYMRSLIYKDDPLFLSARLMQILQKYDRENVGDLYEISNELAEKGDFTQSEVYYQICIGWAKSLKDENLISVSLLNLAELYAEQAEKLDTSDALSASHWLQKSIEIYKTVPDSRERRDELYSLLLKHQKESLNYMEKISTPIDFSEAIDITLSTLKTLSVEDALVGLGYHIMQPPSYDKLEATAKKMIEEYPISHLFGAMHLDGEGRISAKTPSSMGSSEDEYLKVLSTEVFRLAQMEHSYIVTGSIEPGRKYLYNKFNLTESDFFKICLYNPFIEQGQEYIYAKGLYAGFCGDYVLSTHLLSPLIENSLRYVLSQHEVEISSINPQGIQEVLLLNSILSHQKTTEIFGNDIVMDLRGILIERTYGNLRNIVAHGLGAEGYYNQAVVVYFWWLALRLCLVHIMRESKTP